MKTLYHAAAAARDNVKIVQVAPRSHEIHIYDESRRAWIAGPAQPWFVARLALTEARHRYALRALGWADYDAVTESHGGFGRLEERLRRSLAA